MKIFNRIKLNKKSAILLLLLLVAVFVVSGYFEYRSRQKEVLDLMNTMTRNIISTVKKASVNSILSYDYLDSRNIKNMESVLQYLDYAAGGHRVNQELIEELMNNSNLEHVSIYNKEQYPIFSSDSRDIISEAMVTEFFQAPDTIRKINKGQDLILLRKISKGRVIAGVFTRQDLLQFRQNLGIGRFINDVVTDSAVIYIAIQDLDGIIAGSKMLDSLSAINYDPFLRDAYLKQKFAYRVREYKTRKIYESVMPFDILDTYYGIIRIGLSYRPLQNVKNAAIRNVFIRLVILTVIGFIVMSYTMSRNTVITLQEEKQRIMEEVYDLQKNLREKEKQNAIYQLAAGIAHEIGNPLNALSLNVQRLYRNLSDSEGKHKKLMTLIKNEVKRIDNIIKQFLKFSKPMPLEKSKVDMNELINEVIEVYQEKLENNNIALIWNPDGEIAVQADEGKIKQTIINLIENAIEAMPDGGRLNIYLSQNESTGEINLEIGDNGKGIDEETQSKIFNLFFTTRDNGTGIGLSQVYKIIQNHGGDIKVESELGEGTTFKINLPKGV
jgi:signal transduction histidine kinase